MRIIYTAIAIIACLILDACSALYIPDATSLEKIPGTTVSLSTLQEGRSLYIGNCGGCHYLHLPSDLNAAEWEQSLNEMASRTELNSDQINSVLLYLKAGAKDSLSSSSD